MAKVFRLHTGSDSEDWFSSNMISSYELKQITESPKTGGKYLPSSIPSPFARFELVDSAFEYVNSHKGLDDNTDYHQLVSDALDIGQIFFNYQKLSDQIRIIPWDIKNSLETLKQSGNEDHKRLAQTLRLYLDQDGKRHNFNSLDRIFILEYKGQVVGGTSPLTVFCPAPDAKQVQGQIVMGQDKLLDEDILPLYKRDKEYIKFWFALAGQDNFAEHFPQIQEYLNQTEQRLLESNQDVFNEINGITSDWTRLGYNEIPVNNNAGERVEVNQQVIIPCESLHVRKDRIKNESDFVIDASNSLENDLIPLFLPTSSFRYEWQYAESIWDPTTKVPENPQEPILARRLPGDGTQYPWLTGSDFLQDTLIKVPYTIDSDWYVTAGLDQYLLPLTDEYFRYFQAKDVKEHIKMTELAAGAVDVELSIPVRGGTISYKKTYHQSNIKTQQVHLAIAPFVRNSNFYFIGGLIRQENELEIDCYNTRHNYSIIEGKAKERSTEGIRTQYHQVTNSFDVIRVTVDEQNQAFVIPVLKAHEGSSDVFHFAVDFGTTNTHIEYSVNEGTSSTFNIPGNEKILIGLMDRRKTNDDLSKTYERYFYHEMFPDILDDNTSLGFPTRCALTVNRKIDYTEQLEVFQDGNLSFYYEKESLMKHLKPITNLKWSDFNNSTHDASLRLYIRNVLFLLYFKVLRQGGDAGQTRITWFYPTNMTHSKQSILQNHWKKEFEYVFGYPPNNHQLKAIPESIPPYYFYRKKQNVLGLSVSVDIGGATSDISVFDHSEPKFISSVKFGGEALYGDGYSGNYENNAFYLQYKDEILPILKKHSNFVTDADSPSISGILEGVIGKTDQSVEFCNLLFSLSKMDVNFDFLERLKQNPELKLPYYIFYTALIYYIAKSMYQRGLEIPQYILFSGSASQSLSVLESTPEKEELSNLFARIFATIYGSQDIPDIEIRQAEEPKKITGKGGLIEEAQQKAPPMLSWLGGYKDYDILVDENSLKDERIPTYDKISESLRQEILNSISHFYDVIDELFNEMRASRTFGISEKAYKIFRENREKSLKAFLREGIDEKRKDLENKESPIEETLFFYPLVGVINKVSYEVVKSNQS